ncbi:MAG TPA: hypothetical protein VMM18_01410 [Gemmatimonadaceae bacterium]|nr:hypothetical protein [Gemmatimonadaceae bacterium]
MTEPLAAAHVALSALILVWNIVRAGRIATVRTTPRVFAALSGFAGLLIVPALLVRLATANALFSRSVEAIDWIWPVTLALFAAQAVYALARRMSHPLVAAPIALYNVMLLSIAIVEYSLVHGMALPGPAVVLLAAHRSAFALGATPAALASTAYVLLPILAPAFPARWNVSVASRGAAALLALAWVGLTAAELPAGLRAVRSYAPLAAERLRERPAGDLALGVELFPSLSALPSPIAVRNDLAIADSLGADAVSLLLEPAATRPAVLDSLRRAFEDRRRGGLQLVVALGWERDLGDVFRGPRPLDVDGRIAAIERIARRLHPDYLLPAHEPFGEAARAVGELSPDEWRGYLAAAARTVERIDPDVRVAFAVSSFGAPDSVLYAWAASVESPVDAVGFILRPTREGGQSLVERRETAARWMEASASPKEHWVFGVTGLPLAHGERSQRQAIWGTVAWATEIPAIRGVIIADATDYWTATGLRTALGRIRPALAEAQRAARMVRETAQADTVRVPGT